MSYPDLSGRIIAITGADGRLGQRLLNGFAEAGATALACVRTPSDASPFDSPVFAFDATDEAGVDAAFGQIGTQYGRLDGLVHTVGTWAGAAFLDTSLADWERMMRLNLTSAFLCFRAAARLMIGQGQAARLIGIAARQGADRGQARQAAYSASKGGLVRLVEALAAECDPTDLTAYAVAPSTLLFEDAPAAGVPATDLVALCRFLFTDAAPALNGTTLRAYGTG